MPCIIIWNYVFRSAASCEKPVDGGWWFLQKPIWFSSCDLHTGDDPQPETTVHSSRMRTVCYSFHLRGGVCPEGCLPRGCLPRGVCLGVSAWGCLPWGLYLPGDVRRIREDCAKWLFKTINENTGRKILKVKSLEPFLKLMKLWIEALLFGFQMKWSFACNHPELKLLWCLWLFNPNWKGKKIGKNLTTKWKLGVTIQRNWIAKRRRPATEKTFRELTTPTTLQREILVTDVRIDLTEVLNIDHILPQGTTYLCTVPTFHRNLHTIARLYGTLAYTGSLLGSYVCFTTTRLDTVNINLLLRLSTTCRIPSYSYWLGAVLRLELVSSCALTLNLVLDSDSLHCTVQNLKYAPVTSIIGDSGAWLSICRDLW